MSSRTAVSPSPDAAADFPRRLEHHMRVQWDAFRSGRAPRPWWWRLQPDPDALTAGDDTLAEKMIQGGAFHPVEIEVAGRLHATGLGIERAIRWTHADLAGAARLAEQRERKRA